MSFGHLFWVKRKKCLDDTFQIFIIIDKINYIDIMNTLDVVWKGKVKDK